MLKGYASHTRTSESSQNSESTEPRLEASVTLGSDSEIHTPVISNQFGVDSNKFLNKVLNSSLEASLTLESGIKGKSPDHFLRESNGVDSSRFLRHIDDDLKMPKAKPRSDSGVLGAMVSPLKAIKSVKTK